jgi:hypothetical protein
VLFLLAIKTESKLLTQKYRKKLPGSLIWTQDRRILCHIWGKLSCEDGDQNSNPRAQYVHTNNAQFHLDYYRYHIIHIVHILIFLPFKIWLGPNEWSLIWESMHLLKFNIFWTFFSLCFCSLNTFTSWVNTRYNDISGNHEILRICIVA